MSKDDPPNWEALKAGWTAEPALAAKVIKKLLLQPPHTPTALNNFTPLVKRELTRSQVFKKGKVFNLRDTVAIKRDDTNDDLSHEARIGEIMNGTTGFVWTVGLVADEWIESKEADKLNPGGPRRGTKRVQYLLTEWLPGIRLFDWAKDKKIEVVWPILLQNFAILAQANKKNGFTHYDLHGGNTNVRFGDVQEIVYPEGVLTTNAMVRIFDFGRSFAMVKDEEGERSEGVTVSNLFVRPVSAPQHDIFLLLISTFRQCSGNVWDTPSGVRLKTFFGLADVKFVDANTRHDTRYRHFGKVLPIRFKWRSFWKMISELEWSEGCWKATTSSSDEEQESKVITPKPTESLALRNWLALYPWQAGTSVSEWQTATRSHRARLRGWIEQLGKVSGGAHSSGTVDVELKIPPLDQWTLEKRREYFDTLSNLVNVTLKDDEDRESRCRVLKNFCSAISEQLILELDSWSKLQIH
jgi:hypothetical protein